MTRTDSMELRSFVGERDMLGYNVVGGYPAWTRSTTYRVVLLYVCTMYPGVVHGCFWRIAEATYAGRSRLVRSICSGELIERIIIKIKNKIKNTFVNQVDYSCWPPNLRLWLLFSGRRRAPFCGERNGRIRASTICSLGSGMEEETIL